MINRVADGLVPGYRALKKLIGPPRIERRRAGHARIEHIHRAVDVAQRGHQPRALAADIPRVDNQAAPDLFLQVEVPLLNVGVAHVLIVGDREIKDPGGGGACERVVKEQIRRARYVAYDAGAGRGLRTLGHGEDGVGNLRGVVDAVAAADHRVGKEGGLIGKTKARAEVVPVRLQQAAAIAGILRTGETGGPQAVLLDVHELVVALHHLAEIVVADTVVDGEPRRNLPIVVEIVGLPEVVEVGHGHGWIEVSRADIAEHEIGHGAASVGAIEGEVAARIPGLVEGDGAAGDIAAHLQEVLAAGPGEVVHNLIETIGALTRADGALQSEGGENSIVAADVYHGRTEELGVLGDQRQAHLVGDVEIGEARGSKGFVLVEVVIAATQLIHHRR